MFFLAKSRTNSNIFLAKPTATCFWDSKPSVAPTIIIISYHRAILFLAKMISGTVSYCWVLKYWIKLVVVRISKLQILAKQTRLGIIFRR
jgi:hypothetical protein